MLYYKHFYVSISVMGDVLLRLLVTGQIPGTNFTVGYKSTLIFALVVIVSTVWLLSHRRRATRQLLKDLARKISVNDITI